MNLICNHLVLNILCSPIPSVQHIIQSLDFTVLRCVTAGVPFDANIRRSREQSKFICYAEAIQYKWLSGQIYENFVMTDNIYIKRYIYQLSIISIVGQQVFKFRYKFIYQCIRISFYRCMSVLNMPVIKICCPFDCRIDIVCF